MLVPRANATLLLASAVGLSIGSLLVLAITRSSPGYGVLGVCGVALLIVILLFPDLGLLLCAAVIPDSSGSGGLLPTQVCTRSH